MTKYNLGMILIKILLVTLFLLLSLEARENPFLPSVGEKDLFQSSNQDTIKEPLKRATITLPPYSRILQKVTIEFKNLDGSIETRSIELDHKIDWHLPVFISQNYNTKKATQHKKKHFKKIASVKYATFYSSKHTLKILTKDKIIRNFLLVEPHRIVLDLQRDAKLKSYIKSNKNNIFTKIRVGNHDKFYRVVIELDGYYRYKMTKVSGGYIIKLR